MSRFEDAVKKTQMGTPSHFMHIAMLFSFLVSIGMGAFFFMMQMQTGFSLSIVLFASTISFVMTILLMRLVPILSLNSKKAVLESDLLYSARHLLLKIESGSSLINALESVGNLNTKSGLYFKEIVFDISLGMPIEDAIDKAVAYSPSRAFSKIMEEIENSLRTGTDLQKALKATLKDITREHLIQIQQYGEKLNPMTMFYMIIGTMLPSLGTAMLVVGASLLGGNIKIDKTILLSVAFVTLIIQVFFVLAFRSIKPAVMD